MSLEDKIDRLIEALEANTAALGKAKVTKQVKQAEVVEIKEVVEVKEVVKEVVVQESKVSYEEVKDLILKLAPTQRDAIKALNTKYELAKFADILNDSNDAESGVKDAAKLDAYHAELSKLGE